LTFWLLVIGEKGKRKVGVFLERGKPPLTPNFSREGKRENLISNKFTMLMSKPYLFPCFFGQGEI
jgi:hypothetical protein